MPPESRFTPASHVSHLGQGSLWLHHQVTLNLDVATTGEIPICKHSIFFFLHKHIELNNIGANQLAKNKNAVSDIIAQQEQPSMFAW